MRTDDCVVGCHSCDPHVSWVDEHMNYRYDCVSDFRMEKVCGNIMTVGLEAFRNCDCVNKVIQLLSDLEAQIQAECVETKRLQK